MEPATALVTVIGLLITWLQDKETQASATLEDYKEWLRRKEHNEILTLIESNSDLQGQIRSLLILQHAEISLKIDRLETLIKSAIEFSPDWFSLANSICPESTLSSQAKSILLQFYESEEEYFDHVPLCENPHNYLFPSGKNIDFTDVRFIHDDIESLLKHGLIQRGSPKNKKELFYPTRSGDLYYKSLMNEKQCH